MPRLVIGTTPKQIAWYNPKRFKFLLEFLPSSIIAANTGLIYYKRGSTPKADISSNTWDHVLNSGSYVGENVGEEQPAASFKGDIWIISDTDDQVITVLEKNIEG